MKNSFLLRTSKGHNKAQKPFGEKLENLLSLLFLHVCQTHGTNLRKFRAKKKRQKTPTYNQKGI